MNEAYSAASCLSGNRLCGGPPPARPLQPPTLPHPPEGHEVDSQTLASFLKRRGSCKHLLHIGPLDILECQVRLEDPRIQGRRGRRMTCTLLSRSRNAVARSFSFIRRTSPVIARNRRDPRKGGQGTSRRRSVWTPHRSLLVRTCNRGTSASPECSSSARHARGSGQWNHHPSCYGGGAFSSFAVFSTADHSRSPAPRSTVISES